MNKITEVTNKNDKISDAARRREEWVERHNNCLPQEKWYDKEFEIETSNNNNNGKKIDKDLFAIFIKKRYAARSNKTFKTNNI